jgi:hypothetical protein
MTKLENQLVSYNASNDSLSCGLSRGWTNTSSTLEFNTGNCFDWYREVWYPYYQPYYVSYPVYITEKDKFEKAFKIAKLLLKENLLVSRKLKDFIGLVEKIAKEL